MLLDVNISLSNKTIFSLIYLLLILGTNSYADETIKPHQDIKTAVPSSWEKVPLVLRGTSKITIARSRSSDAIMYLFQGESGFDPKILKTLWEGRAKAVGAKIIKTIVNPISNVSSYEIIWEEGGRQVLLICGNYREAVFHLILGASSEVWREERTKEIFNDIIDSLKSSFKEIPLFRHESVEDTKKTKFGCEYNRDPNVFKGVEPPPKANAGDIWISAVDGREMVYVSAGEFLIGLSSQNVAIISKRVGLSELEKQELLKASPQKKVNLLGFWIDKYPVTQEDLIVYGAQAYKNGFPRIDTVGLLDVIYSGHDQSQYAGEISWELANEYCRFYRKTLPTPSQWEKAARGKDGYLYPWGNDLPEKDVPNFDASTKKLIEKPSPYGAHSMVGFLWQWCKGVSSERGWESLGQKWFDREQTVRGGTWVRLPFFHGERNKYKDATLDLLVTKQSSESEFSYSFSWDKLTGKKRPSYIGGTEKGRNYQWKMLGIDPKHGFRCVYPIQ